MVRNGITRTDSKPISIYQNHQNNNNEQDNNNNHNNKLRRSGSSRMSYMYIDDGPQTIRQQHIPTTPMTNDLFEQYLTFCPRIITQFVGQSEIFVTGCCLLADISGFTKISSNLCKQGSGGIDSLRILIDQSFASFVDIIHQFGGDVIAFAGDSLVCLFLPSFTNPTPNDCCMRAIQCGLSITKCRIEGATTHVGITYGQFCLALLGCEGHYAIVMNGTPVDEIAVCLDNAKSEEVVISSSVYHHISEKNPFKLQHLGICSHNKIWIECYLLINTLQNQFNFRRISSNEERISLNRDIYDTMNGVIYSPVIQAVSTGSLSHLSEIRTVTTLFLKLDSYSTDKFQTLSKLNPFYLAMINCITSCGGMLRQFLIDDKGCVLIAVWGVPTANHSNNCCMAVRCSVMMRMKAKELNETVSIGITTGRVYCGIVGGKKRRDYVVIGNSVNLSARLMCKADGDIYMDHMTQQKLPLILMNHILKVTGLQMKGIESPSHYYKYDSLILPSERLRDIHEEQMVIIDQTIRKKRIEIFQIIGMYSEKHITTPFLLEDFDASTELSPKISPSVQSRELTKSLSSPRVLMIQGGSGSGKTATLNYFIRKIHDSLSRGGGEISPSDNVQHSPLSPTFPIKQQNYSPNDQYLTKASPVVYISLLSHNDNKPFYAIRTIVETMLNRLTSSPEDYHKQLQYYLTLTFPNSTSIEILSTIFFTLKDPLQLDITWDELHLLNNSNTSLESPQEGNLPTLIDNEAINIFPKFLFTLFEMNQVLLLAIEDAHFMCKYSWEILSQYYRDYSNCFCILTLRNNFTSEQVISSLRNKRKNSSHSLSPVSPHSHSINTFSSTQDTRLLRGYNSFVRDINPDILHMSPLPTASILKILEKHKLSHVSADIIAEISHGNPSLVWKIINHLKEERQDGLETILSSMRDNTLISSLLKSYSHVQLVILKTASVLGEEFSTTILKSVIPKSVRPFVEEVMELFSDKGFFVRIDDCVYGFSSSLLRKMIYDLIPRSDAILIHTEIAEATNRKQQHDDQEDIFSLVYHYSMSMSQPGHKQLTFHYSCTSIKRCLEVGDIQMILMFFQYAENSCSGRRDYLYLSKLIQQTLVKFSTDSSNQMQIHLLTSMLKRIHSKATFISSLTRTWKCILTNFSSPKIYPSG